MAYNFIIKVLKWTIILGFLITLIHYWLLNKSYIFTENDVATIAKRHIGTDHEIAFSKIHAALRKKYPGHILPANDLQWIFVNAGGAMGSMCVLHASLTEYVLFYGTAVNTIGHTGRLWANFSDTLLTGTVKQWPEGTTKVNIYKPGDTVTHAWGQAAGVALDENTWMVEYARGFIPSTLGFGLADTLFSTQDFCTMFYTFRIYTKALIQEIGFYLSTGKS